MFDMTQDIRSLTDFKRHTVGLMKRIKARRRPMILTVNGKAAVVVQDAFSYQKLVTTLDQADMLASVHAGLQQADHGEGIPLEAFEKKMRRKHGIPR
jgi:prevent-host-death family protein